MSVAALLLNTGRKYLRRVRSVMRHVGADLKRLRRRGRRHVALAMTRARTHWIRLRRTRKGAWRAPARSGQIPVKKVKKKAARAGTPLSLDARRARPVALDACPGCRSQRLTEGLCLCRHWKGRNGEAVAVTARGCVECGLVFASHFPPPESIQRMYTPQGSWGSKDTVAHKHDGLSPAALALVSDVDLFRGGNPDRATVLDIGCGVGYILDAFAHRGYRTFGIEPATDVAFDVHQRLAAVPRTTCYDVVILNHVIEHLTEPFDLLNQAADAVADGGVLVIGVPGLDALPTHGNLRYVVNGHHHLCAFSRACLQRALRRRGFCAFRVLDDGTTTRRMRLIAARFEDGAGQNDDVEAAFRTLEAFGRLHAVTGERS